MLQKSTIQIIAYLVVVGSVLLNACSPLTRTTVTAPGSQPTPEIQIQEPGKTEEPAPATQTPNYSSIESLLEVLKSSGVNVESVEKTHSTLLDSPEGFSLKVAKGEFFIYMQFASAEAALAASQRVGPDGTEIKGLDGSISSVRWVAPPHFWLHDSFIVQYLGDDEALLAGLEKVLGGQFAGMSASEAQARAKSSWKEVRIEENRIGFAVPCWWLVGDMPSDGVLRSQTMRSYDDVYFQAHSERGEWKDGITPEGAYKVDITLAVVEDPHLPTEDAYKRLMDLERERIIGSTEILLGENTWSVFTLQNLVNTNEEPGKIFVRRMAQNELMIVSAYPWPTAIESSDVQAILSSFAVTSEQAVVLPTIKPHPPIFETGCMN